jgi:hypothetical protein
MKNNDTKYCILENDNPKVALCVCKHHPCHKQFPKTFEELKEWCKNVKDIVIHKNIIFLEREDFGRIEIYNDGGIWCDEHCIGEKRTPPQIWNFIKSLTEE